MRYCYRFAGLELEFILRNGLEFHNEFGLGAFRTEHVEDPHRVQIETVKEFPEPEGELLVAEPNLRVYTHTDQQTRYIGNCAQSLEKARAWVLHNGKEHRILLKQNAHTGSVPVKTVLEALSVEHLVAQNNGFVFHCSYIDRNGKAILFTAPSGTGKSTQADLWAKHRGAEIINGDRAAVRLMDGDLVAEGIPFAGSSQYCKNRSLPIEAIVYLSQAPQTAIRKICAYEAFSKIWKEASVNTWDKQDLEQVATVVQHIVERIPVLHLSCTPDESAVIALEESLRKQV